MYKHSEGGIHYAVAGVLKLGRGQIGHIMKVHHFE